MKVIENFLILFNESTRLKAMGLVLSTRPASHTLNPHARDINTALVKLYAESHCPEKVVSVNRLLAEVTIDQMAESDANIDYIGES